MTILALDPGKITGVATYDKDHGGFESFELINRRLVRDYVLACGFDSSWGEVVAEDFVISQRTIKTTPQKDPLIILGWLDLNCSLRGVPFTLQTAATAKSFATDDKLKHLGWFTTEGAGHANDAARHLAVYMANNYRREFAGLMKGYDLD